MQYLMLIYHNELEQSKGTEQDRAKMYEEYGKFSQDLAASGKLINANELKPTTAATTVRVRDAKRLITDGPFAETKEQLAGYYLVEAKDLDDAIAIAARIPSARNGSIEVRPVAGRAQAAQQ